MKNAVLKFVSVLFFVFVIFGCTNIEQIPENKTTSISISLDSSSARAINPNYNDNISRIVLKGKIAGSDEKELRKWETTEEGGYTTYACRALTQNPVINDIEVGEWTFTLNCYNADGAEICSATETATLSADVASIVRFKLENTSGEGSVEIGLSIYLSLQDTLARNYMGEVHRIANGDTSITGPQSYGYSIKACLKNLEGTVEKKSDILPLEITDNPSCSVYYAEEEIPSGSYIVSFMVYEKKEDAEEVLLTTVSELVNVAPGINTTTGYNMLTLASLNKSYPINYARYVYTYVTDEEYTEKGEFDASWLTGNIPLTYTEYDTITLPTAIDVLRPCDEELYDTTYYTCYAFNGWYLDEDLEHPIEKIIGSEQSGEINLYASFKELRLRYSATTAVGVKDPGKLTVDFETNATLTKEWLEKIEWSLDRDDIIQIDNLKPDAFHEEYTKKYNGEIYTYYVNYVSFENAKALKFGKATLSAKINDILIGACEIEFSPVFTQEVANAFYPDKTITTMEVPDIYTSAAHYAFSDSYPLDGYPNLETVILPDTFTSIGDFAFANCGKLKDVNIPNGVTYIGEYAFGSGYDDTNDVFYDCKFETITIPATVKTIGRAAFMRCKQLKTVIVEPENPPALGEGVFDYCDSLEAIYVPYDSLDAYKNEWSAYSGKIQVHQVELTKDILKSIEPNWEEMEYYSIPNSYTSIAANTFSECTKLKGVKIPGSISSIGDNAFNNLLSLTVVLKGDNAPTLGDKVFDSLFNFSVYVEDKNLLDTLTGISPTDTTVATWQNIVRKFLFASEPLTNVIKSSILTAETLGSIFGFEPDTSTGCAIPYGYTKIEDGDSSNYVFTNCKATLQEVTIPESMERIGNHAFYSCTKLNKIALLSETPPELGEHVFDGCHSDLKIYVPSDAAVTNYKNAENWSALDIQISQGS